jgi:osmotically-inducible protein OsmY
VTTEDPSALRAATGEATVTDEELEPRVAAELSWDPRVDSAAITVTAYDSVVTLAGTVDSVRQKREAKRAAERVHGVVLVDDELDVRVRAEHRRDDADLRRDVRQALALDEHVPATVDALVDDGFVTLVGTARWQHQRAEAEFVAASLRGVTGVDDAIELAGPALAGPGPAAGNVRDSIKDALRRHARLEADNIGVEIADGTATLTGDVRSVWERDTVIATAWSAPGVRMVNDRLDVFS